MRHSQKYLLLIIFLFVIVLVGFGTHYLISIDPESIVNTLFFGDEDRPVIPYTIEEFDYYSFMDYVSAHGVLKIDSDRRKDLLEGIQARELNVQKALDVYGDSLESKDSPSYWNPAGAESLYVAHPILIDDNNPVGRQMFIYFKDENHVVFYHSELW